MGQQLQLRDETPVAHFVERGVGVSPHSLARLAVQALLEEAELTPKPALVDMRGSGAHHDLSQALLVRSAHTLEPYFVRMAETAWARETDSSLREKLGLLGREAEAAMLKATSGVNTHRGAIWALGLLVASASQSAGLDEDEIFRNASQMAALQDSQAPFRMTNGAQAACRYGAGGARSEAEARFPHVALVGLPALRRGRRAGHTEDCARVDALLAIMTTLEDTCLLHRGGLKALEAAQRGAARVLALGGCSTVQGSEALQDLDEALMALWASPGGAADMLAACLFLDSLTSLRKRSS